MTNEEMHDSIKDRLSRHYSELMVAINRVDTKVDPVLEAARKSKLTPVWTGAAFVASFVLGAWVRGWF